MGIGSYSSRNSRLEAICDHYLDLGQGLREGSGWQVIWPCPFCGRASFVACFFGPVILNARLGRISVKK